MRNISIGSLLASALLAPGMACAVNLNQHGLTGSWYNPATGGQGIELEVYPDFGGAGHGLLFAGWFTYDATVAGGQRWYVLSGDVSGDNATAHLGIYTLYGGNFNAPPALGGPVTIGQATLEFSDCDHGTLKYEFSDGSDREGTIPLTRLTANVNCGANGDNGNAASSHLLSGNWFNAASGGQGLIFDFNPVKNVLFAAWYTFAPNGAQSGGPGSQRWYVMQVPYAPGTTSVTGIPIAIGTGGVFDDPAPTQTQVVGAASLALKSCNAMTLNYAFNPGSNDGLGGSVELTRVGPTPAGCTLPAPASDPLYRVTASTPFVPGCENAPANGNVFPEAEVEPSLVINPRDGNNIVAAWQQDRWSSGGSRGIVSATSHDGGRTWTQQPMPFSRCGGGSAGNDGDYDRASDPWLTASPDGTLHQMALAYSTVQGFNAMVASRSTDGGATWGPTRTLIRDSGDIFNDKNSMTADPVTPHYVYAVWDRTIGTNRGPVEFTRSTDDGVTWEPARAIYDPGVNHSTIGNEIVVLPNGTLVDLLVELGLDANGNVQDALLGVLRSTDHGATWSSRLQIAQLLTVGTADARSNSFVRDGSIVPQMAVAPNGTLYVVWQDSRFSAGARDGIALSRSSDGGLTWTQPVQVNGAGSVSAFTPNIAVRPDGTIGVTYLDFRTAASAPATTLPTSRWLARSIDGSAWTETQVGAPFDMKVAPSVGGGGNVYFVGDYHGLSHVGNVFVPLFAQANATPANRTDVFIAPQVSTPAATSAKAYKVTAAAKFTATKSLRARVNANLTWAFREGPPGNE
jgi:hypothetical protein